MPVTFTDELRAYVAEFGPKAACAIIVAILEEEAVTSRGRPPSTLASINADIIKHAMEKMVR